MTTIRLSASSLAGTARTLVAVGTVSEVSMLATTRAAAPRSGTVSPPVAAAAGFWAGPAGLPAGSARLAGRLRGLRRPAAAGLAPAVPSTAVPVGLAAVRSVSLVPAPAAPLAGARSGGAAAAVAAPSASAGAAGAAGGCRSSVVAGPSAPSGRTVTVVVSAGRGPAPGAGSGE